MSYSLIKNGLSCTLTGHRKLGGDFNELSLKNAIENAVKGGAESFYCGMAIGFDLIAAEHVLECKKTHPHVRLIGCIPCPEQDKYFSPPERRKYASLLKQCDEVITVNDSYFNGCMLVRDRFMVDNCDLIIAYFDGRYEGGTAYTLRYAKSKNKKIVII